MARAFLAQGIEPNAIRIDTPGSRPNDCADVIRVMFLDDQFALRASLLQGRYSELGKAVNPTGLFRRHIPVRVEVVNLTSDAHVKVSGVKQRNWPDARAARD
jgi:hypothetical protein